MIIHKLKRLLKLVYFILLLLLIYSVIRSGLYYQYDIDELSQVQHTYLLATGWQPYLSFFLSLTPFFHLFLMPVFKLFGFNWTAILLARVLMVILFTARIAVIFLLTRKFFSKFAAWLFIPLYLFDPFTVFSSMQIRIDNLMLAVFLPGLYFFMSGVKGGKQRLLFLSGILLSLSLLILLKIAPNLIVLTGFFLLYSLYTGQRKKIAVFLTGLFLPLVLFIVVSFLLGIAQPFFQQVIIDRAASNSSILNPARVSFFFKPNNPELFGLPGKPLTWLYIFILPGIAILGGASLLATVVKQRQLTPLMFLRLTLLFMTAVLVLWLVNVSGVFLQYFLNISWLLALLAAYFISLMRQKLRQEKPLIIFDSLLIMLMVFLTAINVKANLNRARYDNRGITALYENYWRIVPEGTATFPNILFRPLSYPLALGAFIGDVPRSVLKRLGPVWPYLERDKVKFLLVDSYTMQYIDRPSVDYILQNYNEDPTTHLWTRK